MSQSECIVTLVNVTSSLDIMSIEALLHASGRVHWVLWLVMAEVSVLEELDSLWGDFVLCGELQVIGLEPVLLLGDSSETAIASLEVRPSDVGGGHRVQASVHSPGGVGHILELCLHRGCWVEAESIA